MHDSDNFQIDTQTRAPQRPQLFIPMPAFMTLAPPHKLLEPQFQLPQNFQDQDQPNPISSEASPLSLILGGIPLDRPLDSKFFSEFFMQRLYGFARFTDNEIVMPRSQFAQMGLSQPAWVLVDVKDQYQRIAVAYVNPDPNESQVLLGPRFTVNNEPTVFGQTEVQISHITFSEQHQSLPLDCKMPNGIPCPPVVNLQLELIQRPSENNVNSEMNMNEIESQKLIMQKIKENPQIVQIGDLISVEMENKHGQNISANHSWYKVVSLSFKKDMRFMQKILDITDPEIAEQKLVSNVYVDEMTLNANPGYLCHAQFLKQVEVINNQNNSNQTYMSSQQYQALPKCFQQQNGSLKMVQI